MEYTKDKRTENLTLRDIHVGDWVQVWSEQTERYSPPLKIIQICDDGTIYLVTSDEERPTPFEENIKNVDALPITKELLQGFGFDVVQKDYPNDEYDIIYNGEKICELWMCDNLCTLETPWNSYEYFHEFMDHLYYVLPKTLKLEWKGITVTSKTKHCGECKKFAYEDTDGYGFCLKTNMECRCSDKCHITHEKP